MQGLEVSVLGAQDAAAAAAVIGTSHRDYPAFRAVFPDDRQRAAALAGFFRMTFADATRCGDGYGVRDRSGRLIGVAVWRSPERFGWSAWRELRGIPQLLRVLAAAPRRMGLFMSYGRNAAAWTVPGAWNLEVLGVLPRQHGAGAGSALVRHGLSLAAAVGSPAAVRTSDPNVVTWYRRFGFEVVEEQRLVPGGPPHMALVHPGGPAP